MRISNTRPFALVDLVTRGLVETPEIRSARDIDAGKTFYVGRRGTGKTAITFFLREKYPKNTLILLPKLLSSADAFVSSDWDQRVRQKPFNTLVSSFVRAILDEAVAEWRRQGLFTFRSADGSELTRERNNIEQFEFDLRLLNFIDEGFGYLKTGNSKDWLRFRNRPEKIAGEISAECGGQTRLQQFILIDRLDHTFGSLLLQNGASIVYVKEKMGHSSIQVTVDTYGHLIPGANVSFVDRLDEIPNSRSKNKSATIRNRACKRNGGSAVQPPSC